MIAYYQVKIVKNQKEIGHIPDFVRFCNELLVKGKIIMLNKLFDWGMCDGEMYTLHWYE